MNKTFLNPEKGTWVLLSFIAFFGVIVAVNTVFITTALTTHSGVVTDRPYEKGLAYNDTLKAAQSQPDLQQASMFNDGTLSWEIKDEQGNPIKGSVTARLVRPVKGGYDYDVSLTQTADGVYETHLDLPMKGRWEALLKAEWQTQHYQTRFSFIAR